MITDVVFLMTLLCRFDIFVKAICGCSQLGYVCMNTLFLSCSTFVSATCVSVIALYFCLDYSCEGRNRHTHTSVRFLIKTIAATFNNASIRVCLVWTISFVWSSIPSPVLNPHLCHLERKALVTSQGPSSVIPLNHYSSPISTAAPLRVTRQRLQQFRPNLSVFACFLFRIGRFVLSWAPQAQLTVTEGGGV